MLSGRDVLIVSSVLLSTVVFICVCVPRGVEGHCTDEKVSFVKQASQDLRPTHWGKNLKTIVLPLLPKTKGTIERISKRAGFEQRWRAVVTRAWCYIIPEYVFGGAYVAPMW